METSLWITYVLFIAGLLLLYCNETKIKNLGKIILIACTCMLVIKLLSTIIVNSDMVINFLFSLFSLVMPILTVILVIILLVKLINNPDKKKSNTGKAILGLVLFWLISGAIAFILFFMTCFGVVKW